MAKDLFGVVNWNLIFEWHEVSQEDRARKPNMYAPHATPCMAGGLFAIERSFFEELGFYDQGKGCETSFWLFNRSFRPV